jgi:cell division protein ZapA
MPEQKNEVTVNVQNVEISVRTDKDPEYIKKIAEYVNDRMQRITQNASFNSVTSMKIAIMAALDIANEVFELKLKNKEMEETIKNKTEQLVGILEEGIK